MDETINFSVFTDQELLALAAAASTIDERLAGGYIAIDTAPSKNKAARHLAAWCATSTDGDRGLFSKRLAADGFNVSEIEPLLGDVRLAEKRSLPKWVQTFRWAFDEVINGLRKLHLPGVVQSEHPLPFQELFIPVITAARERRDCALNETFPVVSEAAQAQLQRHLLHDLSRLCTPILQEWLGLFQTKDRQPGSILNRRDTDHVASLDGHAGFAAGLSGSELKELFCLHVVLARLLATLIDHWSSTTTEFLQRLQADLPLIQEKQNGGQDPGPVTGIESQLSDPHNGGRTVLKVTFADGLSIAYTPKDVGQAIAWRALLSWLDAEGAPQSAVAPVVIERNGYGWVEWIDMEPCTRTDGAAQFFRRAGAMQCLLQLLQGTDFHHGNVVAKGDAPVPVDVEALMHPFVRDTQAIGGRHRAVALAANALREAGVSSGYLPTWMSLPGNQVLPVGGLNTECDSEAEPVQKNQLFWQLREQFRNLPQTPRGPVSVADCKGDFLDGYEAMYLFLLQRKGSLVASDGPLSGFQGRKVRVILRPTRLYDAILRKSLSRLHMSDGVAWSLHFDLLARFSDWGRDAKIDGLIQRAERRCLQSLDIPVFSTTTQEAHLTLPDGALSENHFKKNSFDQVMQRVASLSPNSMTRTSRIIALSLAFAVDKNSHQRISFTKRVDLKPHPVVKLSELTDEQTTVEALKIAALLNRKAFRANGGAAWIGAAHLPGRWRRQIAVLGPDLFEGAAGIAVFLSALHACTGDYRHRDLALSALAPLRKDIRHPARRTRLGRLMTLGGGAGIGSLIYALVRTGRFLDDKKLVDDATRLLGLISNRLVTEDRSFGLMYGTAGAILGLLTLYREIPGDEVLERALDCGRHLITNLGKQQLDQDSTQRKAWDVPGLFPRNAGVALALLQLYAASGDTLFRVAGKALYEAELALLSKETGDMLAGQGLACLACCQVLEDTLTYNLVIDAASRVAKAAVAQKDEMPNGSLGCVEFLFEAGRHLSRPDLIALARHRATLLLTRSRDIDSLWQSAGESCDNPGFFNGVAGVGYQLLRFRYPAHFPSVALLE